MDTDTWSSRTSSVSKKYQSRSEILAGFDDFDIDDDVREVYPCAFCPDYFDIVGLCCHIEDEHPVEAKKGVCPVCSIGVGVDMVAHMTLEHGNVFKMQRRRIPRRNGGSQSTLSLVGKELWERNIESLFGGSSYPVSSSGAAPDPLLSSFMLPIANDFECAQVCTSVEAISAGSAADKTATERKSDPPPLSVEDQKERAKRCEFVQELLISTILDYDL